MNGDEQQRVCPKDLNAWQALSGRKTQSTPGPKLPGKTTDAVTAALYNKTALSGSWWEIEKHVLSLMAKPKKGGFTMHNLTGVDDLNVEHPLFANAVVTAFYAEAIRANPSQEEVLRQAENVALATIARLSLHYRPSMINNYIVQLIINQQADGFSFPAQLTSYMKSIQMAMHCVISTEKPLFPPDPFCIAFAIDSSWCNGQCGAPHKCPICGQKAHSIPDCRDLMNTSQSNGMERVRKAIRAQVAFQARSKNKQPRGPRGGKDKGGQNKSQGQGTDTPHGKGNGKTSK